ncbi:GAF and ANTAR domain-containing protein [Plantactinospora sp. S1510]|uniref:GAF and ANTAR domain-containing protein n=1 Tax=Plantactinospora alkalitolerans TaxID=2789879 RepID=A0ABS0H4D3_9ACTN|nr:GAF and ANTAR domain-containing protein [Plantactinospora alkalitolerans]MBF9133320.1 GAF and ANTAR domain-containing protein [Plantactinospora alkalitolerans]
MTAVSPERLAKIFVEISDTLVDEFDLIDLLHTLTCRAAEVAASSIVGLVLADHYGKLQFVAASREEARILELLQIQNDEGPCLDAFRTGALVADTNLRDASGRWPRFVPHAVGAGIHSVYAFPLRLRAQVIGALNVFGAAASRLQNEDVSIVQAMADLASIAILHERAMSRGEELTAQLQHALNSRVTIEQAKGAIAQREGITVDEAFVRMRHHARSTNQRLLDVARTVVNDIASVPELRTSDS